MGEIRDGVEGLEEEVGETNGEAWGAVATIGSGGGERHVVGVVGGVDSLSVLIWKERKEKKNQLVKIDEGREGEREGGREGEGTQH